ncbi:hypothetical protein BIW11_01320 [Tropilaelaps mercedesae]|uniref:Uncharacterized protein n=1 Tax=Tropilaelaps mercedesae TaxID=418985 RepID=A0A1V9XG10_9ACAR|nr:hypothetical protein BIW11_01320 [Tropilaelaps mercedesae]
MRILRTNVLNIEGRQIEHIVIPMRNDGASLFRAISHLVYGSASFAMRVREAVVGHVIDNWTICPIRPLRSDGSSYASAAEYFIDMSRPFAYGGLCELVAAGQLYEFVVEAYLDGELYMSVGEYGCALRRIGITWDTTKAHFDVYQPLDEITGVPIHQEPIEAAPGGLVRGCEPAWRRKAFLEGSPNWLKKWHLLRMQVRLLRRITQIHIACQRAWTKSPQEQTPDLPDHQMNSA